jgi:glycosyltransferase involved in cell wall biosynthesis
VVIYNLLGCLGRAPELRVVALGLNEGQLTARLRERGITTYVVPEARHTPLGILWQAARVLRSEGVSVIHSHRYKENVLAWLLAKRLRVADLVATIHGLPESPNNRGRDVQRLGRWQRLDHVVLRRRFASVVAVSDEMKRALVGRYGFREGQVRVIRNGAAFPADLSPAPSPGEGFHIGTVARMVPIKGLDLFLAVAARLHRQVRGLRFSILGDGPLREELARQAAALGIADRVTFEAPRPDAFGYYRSLDLYLNTSVHEGLPLSVVEAMACGKPIVSAAVGGIPEIVEHGKDGFLIEGRDPAVFAERCLALVRDPVLCSAMASRAAGRARRRLSADAMAESYRELYGELSRRRHPCAGVARPSAAVSR